MHVRVWEHIVSLNYRITRWIFTKLGRDKVLMTPHICIDFWAKSTQGRIQDSKGILLQSLKAAATNKMYSNDLKALGKKCCYFWFHSDV